MALFPGEIIFDKAGQTGNRFWSYLDSVAKAVVTGKKLRILFWNKDIRFYDALRNSRWVSFPLYSRRLVALFGKHYLRFVTYLFGNRLFVWYYKKRGEKHGFVAGWKRRNENQYYPSVKEEVRRLFRPNDDVVRDVEGVFGKYREQGSFIVGVHIRGGDYREWEDGRYFFEIQEYAAYMRQLVLLYPDRDVRFFISTNEKYDRNSFEGLNLIETGFPSSAHDLYALSLCDRIIGPLSTFSRWASFYGAVPLCFLERGVMLSESGFSVIESFYRFENGKEIVNLSDR